MTKDNNEQNKSFVEEHKKAIIVGGVIIGAAALAYVYKRTFRRGVIAGGLMGFHHTIDWFDSEFTDLNLAQLYDEWAKQNPDKIKFL